MKPNFPSIAQHTNVKAILRVIREGESNQLDDGPHSAYRAMYHPYLRVWYEGALKGGHPRRAEELRDGSGRHSTAFGAYQFVWTTWDAINAKYGLEDDIAPVSQDYHAIALIIDVGALDDVLEGRFDEALRKLGKVWASLPNSSLQDGGSKVLYQRARAVWERYGGNVPAILAIDPSDRLDPAPIEDRSTQARPEDVERINQEEEPVAAPLLFIVPLLQSLFEAFSPLVRAKVTRALDKQGVDPTASAQVADNLMGIVKNAAGQAAAGAEPRAAAAAGSDPLVAVATVKARPELVAQVEAEMSAYIDQIMPLLDRVEKLEHAGWAASEDSMDRAAERAKGEVDLAKPLVQFSAILVGVLVAFACLMAGYQVYKNGAPSTEVWAQIAGLIGFATGVWVTIVGYRFGTSRSSTAKDVVIAELTQRRKA